MSTSDELILSFVNNSKKLKEVKLKSFKDLKKILDITYVILEDQIKTPAVKMEDINH